jgi:hypothetical protein
MTKINKNVRLLSDVKENNPGWFSKENKRFFNDVSYSCYYSKLGNRYFLQVSYKWSDMLGQPKKKSYIIKNITDDFKIGVPITEFSSLAEVKNWLKNN